MQHETMKVKHIEVEKEVYAIWVNDINLGLVEKSNLRHLLEQLDNIIT